MKYLDPYIHIFYAVMALISLLFYLSIRFRIGTPMKKGTLQEKKIAERVFLVVLAFDLMQFLLRTVL